MELIVYRAKLTAVQRGKEDIRPTDMRPEDATNETDDQLMAMGIPTSRPCLLFDDLILREQAAARSIREAIIYFSLILFDSP